MKRYRSRWIYIRTLLAFVGLACSYAGSQSAAPAKPSTDTPKTTAKSTLEILSDTQGVDFGPYLAGVVKAVKMNWYNVIPAEARAPQLKSGEVTIQFAITRDGKIHGMKLVGPSGDVMLDRAAWAGITACDPLQPLPEEFRGPYLALRMHFLYNRSATKTLGSPEANPSKPSADRK